MDNNEMNSTPEVNAPANKKKSSFSPVKIGIVVVIALVLVVIAANGKAFANTVKKAFSSPEKYYQSVEANALTQSTEMLTSVYNQTIDTFDLKDFKQSVTISAELGSKLQKFIKKETDVDISKLGAVSVSLDAMMKKDIFGIGVGLAAGKKSIASINAIFDMENLTAYVQVPEINKKYIGVDVEERMDADEYHEVFDQAKSFISNLPKKKELDKLAEKYIKAALAEVTKVKKSTGTIEVGGVSQKCTVLEVELDEDVISDMLEAVADQIEKDKDLKKILEKIEKSADDLDFDSEEIIEDLVDELLEAADEIGREKMEITMTVYVDGKGVIRGRSFNVKVTQSYENWYGDTVTETMGGEIEILFPVKGNKVGFSATIKSKDADGNKDVLFKAEGTGKQSMGSLTGDLKIKVRGVTVADVAVKKFDLEKLKKGYLNGTFTVSASDTIASMLEKEMGRDFREFLDEAGINLGKVGLEIACANSAKNSKVELSAIYKDEMLFKVSAERDTKADAETKAPAEKNVIMVEDNDDFSEWLDECDWDGFLKSLKKTTLPEELIDMLDDVFDDIEDMDGFPFGGRADTSTVPVYRGDDYYDYDGEY